MVLFHLMPPDRRQGQTEFDDRNEYLALTSQTVSLESVRST